MKDDLAVSPEGKRKKEEAKNLSGSIPFAFYLLPFTFCLLPFAFYLLPFAFCPLPSAFCLFCLLPSSFIRGCQPQKQAFHRVHPLEIRGDVVVTAALAGGDA
jgi:hypothetical protein